MENRLQQELTEKYKGRKVKDSCTNWSFLENEELLVESSTIDDEDLEITETMRIWIETDGNDCIKDVRIGFHTSCWGDSGLGEEDPGHYWSYGECFDAAEEFIQSILE